MTRKECLEQAMGCVLQDRASQYGGPEDNFGRIAKLWSTYTGTVLDGIDVAMMMSLLKVARIRNNKGYEDGYIDLAGYAACGAELAGKAEAYRQFIEKAGAEYKKFRAEAEAKDFEEQAKGEVRLIFKSGDPVEWFSFGRKDAAADGWHPAFYLCRAGDLNYHIVQDIDGMYHVVNCANLRSPEAKAKDCGEQSRAFARENPPEEPEANYPKNPDSSTETKPKFKHGDRVQYRVELPSVSDSLWRDATYLRPAFSWQQDGEHIVSSDLGPVTVKDKDIRPAPKAEGCEALVEKDAPQTPQELYQHIVDCNPATYGRAHKPTGEELAAMAEEEKRG